METPNLYVWAKLGTSQAEQHPLICHLLDTGHVAAALWDHWLQPALRQWIGESLQLSEADARPWVALWASLHDIGKATPSFQRLAERTAPALLERLGQAGLDVGRADPRHRHDLLGRVVLHRLFTLDGFTGRLHCRNLARHAATLLAGHHGTFPRAEQTVRLRRQTGGRAWHEEQLRTAEYLATHWQIADRPRPACPSSAHQAVLRVLAGLVCVADWLASCEAYFPYARCDVDLARYAAELPERSGQALRQAGWLPAGPIDGANREFTELFPFPPNGVQRSAVAAGRRLDEPGLLIVEAPTGSGKTEAAAYLTWQFLRRFGHQGAYVALPTQATSNQMFTRFGEFLAPGRCRTPA